MDEKDRRRAERIVLIDPLKGHIGESEVSILEVGLLGARLEHSQPLQVGSTVRLEFEWDEEELSFESVIARSDLQLVLTQAAGVKVYHTGIEFRESSGRSTNILRRMIADHVTRSLAKLKANARGGAAETDVPFLRESIDNVQKSAPRPAVFVSCRLDPAGKWTRKQVLQPKQPLDGFTLPAATPEGDLDMLCKTYESGTEEMRQMIRVCSELTITQGEKVPPDSIRLSEPGS